MISIFKFAVLALAFPLARAGEGIVTVLETPLFSAADARAPVSQYARKGDKLFLHDQDMSKAPTEADYDRYDADAVEHKYHDLARENTDGFYRTSDKNGQTAWVMKSHVKTITGDAREELTPIRPFKRDPTDYRLAEPLPPQYPIYDPNRYRAGLLFSLAPSEKRPYPYAQKVVEEKYASRKGADMFYTKKVSFDPYERMFFGGSFSISQESADLLLSNGAATKEKRYRMGIGPLMTYDFYRDEHWRLAGGGGIMIMHDGHKITQENGARSEDVRSFTGYFFSPHVELQLQRKDVFPSLDLVLGASTSVDLAHSIDTKGNSNYPDQWNTPSDEVLDRPLRAQFSVLMGIQSTY